MADEDSQGEKLTRKMRNAKKSRIARELAGKLLGTIQGGFHLDAFGNAGERMLLLSGEGKRMMDAFEC